VPDPLPTLAFAGLMEKGHVGVAKMMSDRRPCSERRALSIPKEPPLICCIIAKRRNRWIAIRQASRVAELKAS